MIKIGNICNYMSLHTLKDYCEWYVSGELSDNTLNNILDAFIFQTFERKAKLVTSIKYMQTMWYKFSWIYCLDKNLYIEKLLKLYPDIEVSVSDLNK